MDLNAIMAEEFAAALNPETIREAVKKQMGGIVQGAIKSAFESYRDGPGRELTKKVEAAVGVQVASVDLSAATLGLTEIVSSEVSRYLQEMAIPLVRQRLAEVLKPAPEGIAFTDVVESFKEWAEDQRYRHNNPRSFALILKESDHSRDYVDAFFHPSSQKRKGYGTDEAVTWYDCDAQIRFKKDPGESAYRIWALTIRGLEVEDGKVRALTLTPWEVALYKMFIAGTRFTIHDLDADLYDTRFEAECECG